MKNEKELISGEKFSVTVHHYNHYSHCEEFKISTSLADLVEVYKYV